MGCAAKPPAARQVKLIGKNGHLFFLKRMCRHGQASEAVPGGVPGTRWDYVAGKGVGLSVSGRYSGWLGWLSFVKRRWHSRSPNRCKISRLRPR